MATSHPGPEDREAAALDALIGDTSTPDAPRLAELWNCTGFNTWDYPGVQ